LAIKVIDNVILTKQDVDTAKVKANSTLSMRMQVFEDGVDTTKAVPLITLEASEMVKGQVENQTDQQLVDRAKVKIIAKFQAEIDRYVAEQKLQSYVNAKAISDSLDASKIIKAVIK
jgi:hypothetical protein